MRETTHRLSYCLSGIVDEFEYFDRKRVGKVTRQDFRGALKRIGVDLDPRELGDLMLHLDSDVSGLIPYEKFVDLAVGSSRNDHRRPSYDRGPSPRSQHRYDRYRENF